MGFTFEFFVNMHFVIETHFLNLIFILYSSIVDPGGAMVKNLSANAGDTNLISGQEDPLEQEITTHPSILGLDRLKFTKQFPKSFPGGSEVKAPACSAGNVGSIPGSGRSPGEGNGNPLQYSCLENPMDRGAWWATVHGVAKSRTRLSDLTFHWVYFLNVLVNVFASLRIHYTYPGPRPPSSLT